ncbi:hypothetical protein AWU65_24140 [Paenibacillus glucanolyticus]|uniref:Uncharacterized protein n=1 Tax=Paenibacillus glucanolyticus TaxID=59843 RepID=A0A163M786_9BACL|nr:hypothetical protein [Paenibacillus glucanolyticus]KZS48805.1 hypothetical protein AWU65_24140 [Paenibacillus glucanolyticus]
MEQPSSTGILNYVLKSVGLFGFRRYGRPDPIGMYSVGPIGGLYSVLSLWISSVIINRNKKKIAVSMKETLVVKQNLL